MHIGVRQWELPVRPHVVDLRPRADGRAAPRADDGRADDFLRANDLLCADGRADSGADESRAFINAVAHPDGTTDSDADTCSHARADAGARAGADAAADA